jgi:alanine racemase
VNYANQFTSYAVIDLDAVAANVRAIKRHIGDECEMIAVVKANGYGHGATLVGRAALDAGASRLAVARVDEGIALRQAGIVDAPILVMGYAIPGEAERIAIYELTATVISMDVAQAINAAAQSMGRTARVHLKIDTGMGRFGLLPDEVLSFVEQISQLKNLDLEGIYTHYATSDAPDKTFTMQQYAVYAAVINTLKDAGYEFRLRHTANSAATIDLPATHLDAVRIGIALYGLNASEEMESTFERHPVLTLKSHVGRVRTLPAGWSIGYGRSYVCETPRKVALVPVGYGDGYRRWLSNKGMMLIGGTRVPVLGRVSMDQTVVDVSDLPEVQENDEVVLIGKQGDEQISAEEIAATAGTNNYEIVTALLGRMPRIAVRSGEVVEIMRIAD